MSTCNVPAEMSLAQLIEEERPTPLKLHLGCGGVRWKDFLNVDLNPAQPDETDSSRDGCVADCYADMRDLGLPDNSVDEIFTSHTIDHFTRWEGIDMFSDWKRMLKPGGKAVMEAADFRRCVLWLFHPRKHKRHLARTQFYGNQWDRIDYETHRYLWSSTELARELKKIGYSDVSISHQTETHYPGRDMRITAIK
ncbi:class I SAM-dependent methyltransferase [Roseiconus nitratireducens]|uniref:Class I SAM-dependent methyltransferase n=1 Tax=Roseiconus nitratireducens TaxID=2605748 RepID=A0A5M6DF06_9BACT|nr:methyltransferase domain-containing protein [Roseiconus nitratireducens]KAA5546127.1 class I SAM-dependent methyltransferase [Roseiconus nitratireducens]